MFIFVCWTPYQIFNAINFVENNIENSKNKSDLFIYHEFPESEQLAKQIRNAKIFSHVYDVEEYDKKKVWYSKMNKVKRLMFPYMTIKKYLHSDIDVREQGYETLIISGNNLFSVNLYNAISNLKVYFIDDGLGSYFGDMRIDGMTRLYYWFNKYFKRGPLSYDIKKMYVNNKAICHTDISKNLFQLPDLKQNDKVIQSMKKAFNYKNNKQYTENRMIYLGQPFFEMNEYIMGSEEKVLDCLQKKNEGQGLIIRLHPRQTGENYKGYKIDKLRNLWELECITQIKETTILIGSFSTAQIMPKILSDKEPYIIFLYKIYFPSEYIQEWENVVNELKTLYNSKGKIFCPKTVKELEANILQIEKEIL